MNKYNFKDFFNLNNNKIEYISYSMQDTLNLAYEFAKFLKKKDIVVLNGELGSGKTVFVNGIATFFGIENEVCSPTFTIVNEYNSKYENIYHFDVYRLENELQFIDTIGTDYFYNGISIIEWGNIIKNILPKTAIYIDITKIDDTTRNICIRRDL
ncbi:MAG: tRNA (adenosine(37)-N6)-threonylcarbamoyltransferase complex ATPase subunit type 1 TsaE [Clostridia bacterium]